MLAVTLVALAASLAVAKPVPRDNTNLPECILKIANEVIALNRYSISCLTADQDVVAAFMTDNVKALFDQCCNEEASSSNREAFDKGTPARNEELAKQARAKDTPAPHVQEASPAQQTKPETAKENATLSDGKDPKADSPVDGSPERVEEQSPSDHEQLGTSGTPKDENVAAEAHDDASPARAGSPERVEDPSPSGHEQLATNGSPNEKAAAEDANPARVDNGQQNEDEKVAADASPARAGSPEPVQDPSPSGHEQLSTNGSPNEKAAAEDANPARAGSPEHVQEQSPSGHETLASSGSPNNDNAADPSPARVNNEDERVQVEQSPSGDDQAMAEGPAYSQAHVADNQRGQPEVQQLDVPHERLGAPTNNGNDPLKLASSALCVCPPA